jgi:hypothetical protein
MTGKLIPTFKEFEVKVSLSELIDNDFEGFLDLISELATGAVLLQDISYSLIGVDTDEQAVILKVIGDTSTIDKLEAEEADNA